MEIRKDDSGKVSYDGVHCRLTIERPRGGILIVRISGRDVGEFGAAPMRELARVIAADGMIELFIDARDVQGASLDVSNDWAQWLAKHRARLRRIHMLTGSRFIRITADFVRRFAGLNEIMRIYTDPSAFDESAAHAASIPRDRDPE